MSAEGVKALRDMAAQDGSLMARLQAAMTPEEVVAIAAENGITLTVDDPRTMSRELSEEDLAGVPGGNAFADADAHPNGDYDLVVQIVRQLADASALVGRDLP